MSFKQELTAAYHEMLDIKVSLGYKQRTYMSHILPFIELCADSYPDAKEITKEMLDHWLLTKNFNADSTRRIAIINIRHFARFLNAIGKKAYIPPSEYNVKAQRYLPYIFTDEELVQLFDSIDSLTNRIDRQEYHPELILPVVFRLELCCGMRPGEPFNLKTEDIDLKTGDIFIRKSKRGKDRHIIVSDDMRDLCTVYNGLAGKREWFFQYPDGGQIPTRWAQWHFSKAWRKSTLFSRGNNPRPYDLRHNFATRTLMRWIDEGRDVMALMPYLSTYMGHVSLEETLYYIHLLPERLKSSPGIDWKMLNDIYQTEEGSDEED